MLTGHSLDGLRDHITDHRKMFDALIELIPPKHYFPNKDDEDQSGKYMHNKKNKAPKQVIKESTKKAKKAKLDPDNAKSVLDMQDEELRAANKQNESHGGDVVTGDKTVALKERAFEPLPSGSITELRQKLQTRLQELQAKRKAPAVEENFPSNRQDIIDRRAKKKREKKDSIKQQREKRRKPDGTTGMAIQAQNAGSNEPHALDVKEHVMFGKVDFGVIPTGNKKRKGPTDIAGQLRQAEAKKQRLEKLKQHDSEKASSIEDAERWNKRKEHEKKKSASAWSDRQAQHKKEEEERLKKREANIKARQEAKGQKSQGKKPPRGSEGAAKRKGK
ncbi:60S ribosome biogenesis protein Rrp14-domain-containing protein [Gaertneriomyces semiglobifer]|nr:60S ribosome biogenesis protein Rrp14-domain-containing protein [Gaertneriomyces semiglobifer]